MTAAAPALLKLSVAQVVWQSASPQVGFVQLRRWTPRALLYGPPPDINWTAIVNLEREHPWTHLEAIYAADHDCVAIGHYLPKTLACSQFLHWSEGGADQRYDIRFRRLTSALTQRINVSGGTVFLEIECSGLESR
jgi:hypothetical protein